MFIEKMSYHAKITAAVEDARAIYLGCSDVAYEKQVKLDMLSVLMKGLWSDLYTRMQKIPSVIQGRRAY